MEKKSVWVNTSNSDLSVLCLPPQGSLDNISIIIVCFPGAPQVTPEALQKEAELEQHIDTKVEGKESLQTPTTKHSPL